MVEVYTSDERGQYDTPVVYISDDKVPVSVLSGLEIDLARVFVAVA